MIRAIRCGALARLLGRTSQGSVIRPPLRRVQQSKERFGISVEDFFVNVFACGHSDFTNSADQFG